MRPWAASIWIVPVLAVSLAAAAPAASRTASGADGLRYAQLIRQDNFDPDAIAIIPADGPLEVVFEWFPEDAENDGDDFGFGERFDKDLLDQGGGNLDPQNRAGEMMWRDAPLRNRTRSAGANARY